jgi:hypothetical protein
MENRYVRLEKKYPRELVLLQAYPCFYGKCKFCDYIADNIGCGCIAGNSADSSVSGNGNSSATIAEGSGRNSADKIDDENAGGDNLSDRNAYDGENIAVRAKGNGKGNVLSAIKTNHKALSHVKGDVPLQVICSASFDELPVATVSEIVELCTSKEIKTLIIESHWLFHEQVRTFKNLMRKKGIKVISLVGVETFNKAFRKNVLGKNLGDVTALEISEYFNWVNILFGIEGQTMESLTKDLDVARRHFRHINVNVFIPNSTPLKRDNALTEEFYGSKLFCEIKDNPKFEILDILDKRAPDTFVF